LYAHMNNKRKMKKKKKKREVVEKKKKSVKYRCSSTYGLNSPPPHTQTHHKLIISVKQKVHLVI
jgi:hypothetical protein